MFVKYICVMGDSVCVKSVICDYDSLLCRSNSFQASFVSGYIHSSTTCKPLSYSLSLSVFVSVCLSPPLSLSLSLSPFPYSLLLSILLFLTRSVQPHSLQVLRLLLPSLLVLPLQRRTRIFLLLLHPRQH